MDDRPVIRLFGPLSIEDGPRRLGPGDLGGARPKQVLEILLAARGHRVPTDRLAELLWGDERPQNVAGSLQTFVSMLRRHLTADRGRARELVVTETEAYRFASELVVLDLDRFDELVESSAGQPTRAARASLEQALALVRGDVLEDEPYSAWAVDLRGSYQGRVLGAHLEAADAALAELDYAPALAHAEVAASLDRFSERAHRSQMLALYALGRQHDALGRYRAFRMMLDDELGLDPTPETRAVESAILRQEDPRTLLPRPIVAVPAGRVEGPSTRLLGRTAELELLTKAVRDAVGGELALIQIEGETGLGKTRLLDELVERLGQVRIGRVSCSDLERHLPYVPLAAVLRAAIGDVTAAASRLAAMAEILPELGSDSRRGRFEDLDVLEALVAFVTENAPLALMFDDVERADHQTLAALAYLRRRVGRVGGALVTTRAVEARHDIFPLLVPDTLVRLEPLSPGDLAPLGIPGLHEATGGNPRFVAEAVACGAPVVPSKTLADALIAQCRAEGPRAYRTLAAAAVLEQPFDPEQLAEILDADPFGLTEELERLCERRLLRVDGLGFRFRYDLVRHVLLESVSPARRRLLKQRVAAG
jgi:DNA-binding SARP family transcriptional activator